MTLNSRQRLSSLTFPCFEPLLNLAQLEPYQVSRSPWFSVLFTEIAAGECWFVQHIMWWPVTFRDPPKHTRIANMKELGNFPPINQRLWLTHKNTTLLTGLLRIYFLALSVTTPSILPRQRGSFYNDSQSRPPSSRSFSLRTKVRFQLIFFFAVLDS